MKRLIDITPELDLRINKVIKTKGYRDFQHFALISLENQVLAESENEDSWKINDKEARNRPQVITTSSRNDEMLFVRPHTAGIKTLESPTDSALVDHLLLWGQYYRLLPAKFGVRILANMSYNQFPSLSEFLESSLLSAQQVQKTLRRIDSKQRNVFGEKISAGFPDGTEKSRRRFSEHFLLSIRRGSGKLDGMLARMKFANVIIKDGEEYIGLTQHGKKFAELHNNVLDESKPPSLSEEEVKFLIDHIIHNLPIEADHISITLKLIKSGNNTRDGLNLSLKKYYEELYKVNWSDIVVNTMRAGLLGRLFEMNLIQHDKKGKHVFYYLTEQGEKVIEMLSASLEKFNEEFIADSLNFGTPNREYLLGRSNK